MYDTINDLFNGNINPYRESRSSDEEYAEAELVFVKVYGQIMKKLDDPELQERFDDAFAELTQAGERIMFCRGFRLGARLTAESFADV